LPLHSRGPEVQAYVGPRLQACRSASRGRFVRASLRIFLEADESGQFRRRVGAQPRPMPSWLATTVHEYATFLRVHRGLAQRTITKRVWQLTRFAESLEQSSVMSLTAIAPSHIQRFLIDLRDQAPATRMTYATTFRSYFGWAYATGCIEVDLRPAVTAPRRFKQRGIRDVLTEDDVMRILSSADRSSAAGRRDYAVLMLAVRYGLRPCDIRQLQLEDLHWREGVLSIRQAKTGRLLTLPLLPDVTDALIAYLSDGRPTTSSRHVFVRHRAPFEPFVAANNLAAIMRCALRRAGLDQRPGRRGLYLFRHTLANRLLTAGCSMKNISDVLGHASTETTMEYASIDLTALRRVSLSEREVRA
jgi:integrase/recombinase XerD